jgi:hypothetical protein
MSAGGHSLPSRQVGDLALARRFGHGERRLPVRVLGARIGAWRRRSRFSYQP